MRAEQASFMRLMLHPLRFRIFLLLKLPAAFFSGVRLQSMSEYEATVRVPYKWFSQNPFKSTYFACLAMAGEMSTGLLAMMHVYKRIPPVSMLVVKLEAQYFKKATGMTYFTCSDGAAMVEVIEKAIATGEGQTITAITHGVNSTGEKVADFYVTWSFKARMVQSL